MTATQMDLLADLEAEQAAADQDAAHRAGDFTWVVRFLTTGKGGRASCIWCRRDARWDHVKNWCAGTWHPRPMGPCTTQYLLGNHVRYYARGLRDRDPKVTDPSATGKRPFDEARCRQMLEGRITKARAAQVDVRRDPRRSGGPTMTAPSKTRRYQMRYQKEWRMGRRRLVDSGPVLAHLEELVAAGWPMYVIALRAGLSRSAVNTMLTKRPARTRVSNAVAIMALSTEADLTDDLPGGSWVPAVGTRRRIRALLALGWTHEHLSLRSGVATRELGYKDRPRVTAAVHRAVADMYEELCMTPGPSVRTRARAAAAGYAPPLAYDDIDDPDEEPDMGAPDGHRVAPLDEWAHLVRLGVSVDEALSRCGTTRKALEAAAYRHVRRDVLSLLGIATARRTA